MSRVYYPRCRVVIKPFLETFKATSPKTESFEAVPQSISIQRNSYKQADSWSITLDAKDVPVPPSLVRAAGIEIYLYDNQNFQGTRELIKEFVKPAIVGLLDDITLQASESGRTLTLSGQDYTTLFIEQDFRKRRVIKGRRLDDELRVMIDEVDRSGVLRLEIETDEELPIVGSSAGRSNLKGYPVKRGDSYWDVMYKLALNHGFILFVRDLDVVLTTPQDVRKNAVNSRQAKFFLSWGRDVESVSQDRKMGKQRVPVIHVTAYDQKTRSPASATFPSQGNKVTTGIGTKRNEIQTISVYGTSDEGDLRRIAEAYYNLLASAEQVVRISTREMIDQEGTNLLEIKTGDSIRFRFDPFNAEAIEKLGQGERAQWFVSRGFTPSAASFMAANLKVWDTFKRPFAVRNADIQWSHSDGFSLGIEMSNFVTKTGVHESGFVGGSLKAALRGAARAAEPLVEAVGGSSV